MLGSPSQIVKPFAPSRTSNKLTSGAAKGGLLHSPLALSASRFSSYPDYGARENHEDLHSG